MTCPFLPKALCWGAAAVIRYNGSRLVPPYLHYSCTCSAKNNLLPLSLDW